MGSAGDILVHDNSGSLGSHDGLRSERKSKSIIQRLQCKASHRLEPPIASPMVRCSAELQINSR